MKLEKATRTISGLIVGLVLTITCLQCRSTGTDVPLRPAEAPAATAAATSATSVSAMAGSDAGASPQPSGEIEPISAWDEPRAIAGLAADCHWTPWGREKRKGAAGDDPYDMNNIDMVEADSPLSCKEGMLSQSCAYDPCFDKAENGRRSCARSCDRCDGACTDSCVPCEAACHDDACRAACATTAGRCKASCGTVRDRCVTAGCTSVYEGCDARRHAAWKTSACFAVCPKLQACLEECADATTFACRDRCRARFRSKCPGDLEQQCTDGKTWPGDEPEP